MGVKSRTQIAFGNKVNLDSAIESKKIDEKDIFCLNDSDEIGWTDGNNKPHFASGRTKSDIEVNGIDTLGVADKNVIPNGSSLDDVIKMIVQKQIHPIYKAPVLEFTNAVDEVEFEVGSTVNYNLKASFFQNDAGTLTTIRILKDGESVSEFATSPRTYAGSLVITDNPVVFTAEAEYADGDIKQDNLGNDDPVGQIKADTLVSDKIVLTGKRYNFFGTVNEAKKEFTSDEIRSLSSKSFDKEFTIEVPDGGQTIVFAVPASYGDATITYREAGNIDVTRKFEKTGTQVADARGGSNGLMVYNIYIYTMKVGAVSDMTFDVKFA